MSIKKSIVLFMNLVFLTSCGLYPAVQFKEGQRFDSVTCASKNRFYWVSILNVVVLNQNWVTGNVAWHSLEYNTKIITSSECTDLKLHGSQTAQLKGES